MCHAFAEPGGQRKTRADTKARQIWFGTARHSAGTLLTAKLTAILSDIGNRQRTSADSDFVVLILRGHRRTLADVGNAVFKTAEGRPQTFAQVRIRPSASAADDD